VSWSSSQLRNLNANIGFNASSAQPYTIKTGIDTNRDLVFNDRPDGIGRNSARGSSQWTMNGYFSYGWSFGKGGTPVPGGVSIRSEGGAITAMQMAPSGSSGRVRLTLNVNVQNITNRSNLGGYIGTITSQAFGHPTVVLGTRKIDVGFGLSF
jgi:hypothetical protein